MCHMRACVCTVAQAVLPGSAGESPCAPYNPPTLQTEDGDDVSWTDFLQPFRDTAPESMQPVVPGYGSKEAETGAAEAMEVRGPRDSRVPGSPSQPHPHANTCCLPQELKVWPLDEHNAKLLDNVHPAAWVDPTPAGTYNMVVIGAGAGGLVTAAGCAGVGARVAIIEQHLYGGDCLNIGCVPSKALLACAHAAHAVRSCAVPHGCGCHAARALAHRDRRRAAPGSQLVQVRHLVRRGEGGLRQGHGAHVRCCACEGAAASCGAIEPPDPHVV